ncbi:hypothetical protein ACKI1J_40605 [Streptomyces scabiei]|uniref:hypothetical protein n=1 Tax=Streptomyces scabiei TaxID=1930 RepID=UPI0038F7FB8E
MLITDAAVREAAATIAQSLGGDWVIDPEAPADGAAHLISTDGKGISFRPIFGGTTVQLWITGSAPPPPPTDATSTEQSAYEAQIAARLPQGHRYSKAATLVTENDEEPETIIMRTLEDDLIPAFEYKPGYVGHQPWIDLFDRVLAAVTAKENAPVLSAENDQDSRPGTDASPQVDAEREQQGDVEGTAAERRLSRGRQPHPNGPFLEPATDAKPTLEPARDADSSNAPDGRPDVEPSSATSRRPEKRSPKRRTTGTATEPPS